MERWRRDMGHKPMFSVASRSVVRQKTDLMLRLLVRVQTEEANSFEDDASRLREVARLAQSAAHDLDPRDEG